MKNFYLLFSNLCIGILFYLLFISPLMHEKILLQVKHDALYQSHVLREQHVASIPLLQKDIELLDKKQMAEHGVTEEYTDKIQLLQELAKEATQSGIQEVRVNPEDQGFSIMGRGSIQQLLVFLQQLLNHGGWWGDIHRIELSDGQNNSLYKIEMQAHVRGVIK